MFALASTDGRGADYVGFNTTETNNTGLSAIPAAGGAVVATADLGKESNQINTTDENTPAATISKIAGVYYEKPAEYNNGASSGAYFFVRARTDADNDFEEKSGIKTFRINDGKNGFEGVGKKTMEK